MYEELNNITMKSILPAEAMSFTGLEKDLAEKFGITPEQLKSLLINCESIDELLSQIEQNNEV